MNKTSEAASKILHYVEDNDVVTWHNLADKHLRDVLLRNQKMEEALQKMQSWFEDLQKEQDDKTMHGLKEACENWQTEWEADKSFDMKHIQAALSFDPLSHEA